ncbi:hypothetical protein Pyn_34898 [Prunus yedoensis var. nudiflora]|uniref:F-box domain-containing protein n=1 Tax=Prunus yedoensis var. nudiflora TaxID=2094558 RepID=A0A314XVV2_PRUYE|nr:hypothetical protein Pyn_34898 [Prunus yedoensis var. nudiflora]
MDKVPEEISPKRTKRWMEATPGDNYIPEEVIHDILLHLPSNSLLECTSVQVTEVSDPKLCLHSHPPQPRNHQIR